MQQLFCGNPICLPLIWECTSQAHTRAQRSSTCHTVRQCAAFISYEARVISLRNMDDMINTLCWSPNAGRFSAILLQYEALQRLRQLCRRVDTQAKCDHRKQQPVAIRSWAAAAATNEWADLYTGPPDERSRRLRDRRPRSSDAMSSRWTTVRRQVNRR